MKAQDCLDIFRERLKDVAFATVDERVNHRLG